MERADPLYLTDDQLRAAYGIMARGDRQDSMAAIARTRLEVLGADLSEYDRPAPAIDGRSAAHGIRDLLLRR